MFKQLKGIRILWIVAALFSLAAALTGFLNPQIYNGLVGSKYIAGTISQDFIAAIAATLLLVISLVMKNKSVILHIIGIGIIGFLFYVYGIYVIEQVYNSFYFVYMAIFGVSFYSLVYSLSNMNPEVVNKVLLPKGLHNSSVIFCFIIPAIFVPLWVSILLPLLSSGQRLENAYSVFILDLCFIMPAFIILAVMQLRKKGLGILLAPSMFILGFTLLFSVGLAEPVKLLFKLDTGFDVSSFAMFCGISVVFLVLGILILRSFKKSIQTG